MDDEDLTFEQRVGAAPLPQQLKLGDLPISIRAPLWAIVYAGLDEYHGHGLSAAWGTIARSYWIFRLHRPADEFRATKQGAVNWIKPILLDGPYAAALGFVEHALRHHPSPGKLAEVVNYVLEEGGAAYRVIGNTTISPISSPAEGDALAAALEELADGGYSGANRHLHKAAEALTGGHYADAVRESIHAVEAVARTLEPAADTLGPALAALEQRGHVHPAMKKGFSSLYGYTSDEKGIRHALLDSGEANVTEGDALYMYGACAAFASYLHRKVAEGGEG